MEDKLIFDRDKMVERMGGNLTEALGYLSDYLQDMPRQIDGLRRALMEDDQDRAEYFSHEIKGAAGYGGAPALVEAASRVYEAAKAGDLERGRSLFLDVGLEFERWQELARKALRADGASQ